MLEVKIDAMCAWDELAYNPTFIEDLKTRVVECRKDFHCGDNQYDGRRYYDTDRVVKSILGGIFMSSRYHVMKTEGLQHDESWERAISIAKEYVILITDEEMTRICNRALDYAASADHWYKFEKEWD
jgi:hypothetical protein